MQERMHMQSCNSVQLLGSMVHMLHNSNSLMPFV
jgi:hypothetical protein